MAAALGAPLHVVRRAALFWVAAGVLVERRGPGGELAYARGVAPLDPGRIGAMWGGDQQPLSLCGPPANNHQPLQPRQPLSHHVDPLPTTIHIHTQTHSHIRTPRHPHIHTPTHTHALLYACRAPAPPPSQQAQRRWSSPGQQSVVAGHQPMMSSLHLWLRLKMLSLVCSQTRDRCHWSGCMACCACLLSASRGMRGAPRSSWLHTWRCWQHAAALRLSMASIGVPLAAVGREDSRVHTHSTGTEQQLLR